MLLCSEVRLYGRDVGGGVAEGIVRERMVSGRNGGLATGTVVALVLVDIVVICYCHCRRRPRRRRVHEGGTTRCSSLVREVGHRGDTPRSAAVSRHLTSMITP